MPESSGQETLNRFSQRLAERIRRCRTVDDLCDMVSGFCLELLPRDAVAVSLYNPKLEAITIRNIKGLGPLLDQVLKILGRDPRRMAFKAAEMTAEESSRYCSGRLELVPGGLYELLTRRLPKTLCTAAERLLGVHTFYVVGFSQDDQPHGGLILLHRAPGPIAEAPYLELLSSLVSLAVSQRQAEQERTELEKRLQQVQKMEALGNLAGGIAHDFNNILTAIIGYTELARVAGDKGRDNAQLLDSILKSASRASELVQQILAFSRKAESEMKPLDINREISGTVQLIELTIPKMISIELQLDHDLRQIQGDPNQIEQVMLNLASNAKDAMPNGGKLIIQTSNVELDEEYPNSHLGISSGHYVRVTVSDSGHGMDEETLEHIFDPFYTTKEVGKGTGLGLASVYGIVKSHGGEITCHSEPGNGTTFEIYLPALESVYDANEAPKAAADIIPEGTETVLVVDDEEAIRDIVTTMLGHKGYQVMTANNGEEALEIYGARGSTIDLVILDISMPGMGGHKCLQELLQVNPDAKVVIASGYSHQGQLKDTLDSGAAGYIAKPFQMAELLRAVRQAMDG